jgi:alkylation response protein AidB-like acyl-CoA dehydrogenase
MVKLGWTAVPIPEAYGGGGLTLAEVVPIVEQMGRNLMASPFVSTTLATQALMVGGRPDQCERLLPPLASGAIGALALMEVDGGWDLSAISAAAKPSGPDKLVLSGRKILVADAAAADFILVSVRHAADPNLVILSRGAAEQRLRREIIVDETRRSFSLDLDGLEVLAADMLDPSRGHAALAHLHLCANLLGAAEMVGGTQAVIDGTLEYLKTRKQFGRLIGSYQALKHPMVEAYIGYEQARSHLYAAAHNFGLQGVGEIAVRMAKARADTAFAFASDRAIQFHGGSGFTYDCDAQLYRRRSIWYASQHGDAAYHKNKLAALIL